MKNGEPCDAQARAGMWIIGLVGSMGILAVLGMIGFGIALILVKQKISVETAVIMVVFTTLSSAIGGAMSGLPSLLARMTGQPEHPKPQDVTVINPKSDPIPTIDTDGNV